MDRDHKLRFHFFHIGDQVITTSLPENYFTATGRRVVVTDDRMWVFKHNPYVNLSSNDSSLPILDVIPDARLRPQVQNYITRTDSLIVGSQSEYMWMSMGFAREQLTLRHPRLYLYEDAPIIANKIVVHTTGSDRRRDGEVAIRTTSGEDAVRVMSDEVIAQILQNYTGWQIVQVGALDDKPLGGNSIDRRGAYDYWQTAKEIATSARFIGVASGPMHIANCYPRVETRVVLMEFPKETLLRFAPGDVRNWLFSWFDPSNMFFNRTPYDIGTTYSYRKI